MKFWIEVEPMASGEYCYVLRELESYWVVGKLCTYFDRQVDALHTEVAFWSANEYWHFDFNDEMGLYSYREATEIAAQLKDAYAINLADVMRQEDQQMARRWADYRARTRGPRHAASRRAFAAFAERGWWGAA